MATAVTEDKIGEAAMPLDRLLSDAGIVKRGIQ